MHIRAGFCAALALALVASGCGPKVPAGEIAASVNDEDITRSDVTRELEGSEVPKDADTKALGPVVVERLIGRKLLAQEARKEGLAKTPEYEAAEQRAREMILASMLAERWAGQVPSPSAAEVQGFIAANPQKFAGRKILEVDQIRTSVEGVSADALRPLASNDAVAAYLTRLKKPFQRGRGTIDTVTISAEFGQQILALAPGAPFMVSEGGVLLSNAIIAKRDAPVPPAAASTVAFQMLKQSRTTEAVDRQLKGLREAAKLTVKPDFAKPAGQN